MVKYWDRLEPEMKKCEMDITALSIALKISFQAVAKVRDGGSFGSKNNLKAAALFGLDPTWLATGIGQKYAQNTAQLTAPSAFLSATGGPGGAAVSQDPASQSQSVGQAVDQAIDVLIASILQTPEHLRPSLGDKLKSLTEAPDSATLSASVKKLLSSSGNLNTTSQAPLSANPAMPDFLKINGQN